MKSYNKNCGQRQKMASEKYATVGRRCISLAVKGHLSEIEKTIDGDIICKLASYEDEAREAWYKAFEVLLSVEKDTKISFHFNEKLKLYALDTLLVADSLGISKKERFEALQVYIIYYLVVHVLDDLAEDHKKFRANFTMINADECEKVDFNLEAAGASFIYIALMTVNEILESGRSEPIETNKIISKFMRSIVMQIKYYTFEKIENLPPEKVFEIKQHNVSGEATAFIADCLGLDLRYDKKTFQHIKNALYYLGSLTQFTDDLRDCKEDTENNNANLFLSMKNNYRSDAEDMYVDWYVNEEKLMLKEIEKTNLNLDCSLICSVPWHPYFMRCNTKLY